MQISTGNYLSYLFSDYKTNISFQNLRSFSKPSNEVIFSYTFSQIVRGKWNNVNHSRLSGKMCKVGNTNGSRAKTGNVNNIFQKCGFYKFILR